MKKILYFVAAAAVSVLASCGSKEAKENTDANAADTTAVVEQTKAPANDLMAQADVVAKKVKAGETLTEDDLCVILDYDIALLEEMMANPEKVGEVLEKYSYADIFIASVDEWKDKAESLKPETQEKLVKFLKLDQN